MSQLSYDEVMSLLDRGQTIDRISLALVELKSVTALIKCLGRDVTPLNAAIILLDGVLSEMNESEG